MFAGMVPTHYRPPSNPLFRALFTTFRVFAFVAAVTRSVSRRLGSFGASRRVFDNFNGAESPWVRLVALLDLSETRPLSALADSQKNWAPIRIAQHNYQLYVGKDGNPSELQVRITLLQKNGADGTNQSSCQHRLTKTLKNHRHPDEVPVSRNA